MPLPLPVLAVTVYVVPLPVTELTAGVPPNPLTANAKSAEPTPVTDSLKVTVQLTLVAFVGLPTARLIEATEGAVLSTV